MTVQCQCLGGGKVSDSASIHVLDHRLYIHPHTSILDLSNAVKHMEGDASDGRQACPRCMCPGHDAFSHVTQHAYSTAFQIARTNMHATILSQQQ